MTPEQEHLAEQLIDVIKKHEGVYNYKEFQPLWEADKGMIRIAVIRSLREFGFIEDVNGTTIRLTTTGWAFLGFEAQRKLDQKEKETKSTIETLTIKQLKGDIFQLKYWWVILLINLAITIIVAWLTKGWK